MWRKRQQDHAWDEPLFYLLNLKLVLKVLAGRSGMSKESTSE